MDAATKLRVIDRALDLIQTGRMSFSCIALGRAFIDLGMGMSLDERDHLCNEYQAVIADAHGGTLPAWWGQLQFDGTHAERRIATLTQFRDEIALEAA